jgi:hypothetical protein
MNSVEARLREAVAAFTPRLLALSESESNRPSAPGKCVMARQYSAAVGPWKAYLSILGPAGR